jgi:hypothetical protein
MMWQAALVSRDARVGAALRAGLAGITDDP